MYATVPNLFFCFLRVVSLSALTVDAEDVLDESRGQQLFELTEPWFVFLIHLLVCHYNVGSVEIIWLYVYALISFFFLY